MSDEKKMLAGKAAFKVLCDMLDEKEWIYDKDEENLEISCQVSGDDLPIEVRMRVNTGMELVTMYSEFPYEIPENKRTEMGLAVNAVNWTLVDGSFDYDSVRGKTVFRITTSYKDSLIGAGALEYILIVGCNTVDQFNDLFLAYIKDNITWEKFLEKVKA